MTNPTIPNTMRAFGICTLIGKGLGIEKNSTKAKLLVFGDILIYLVGALTASLLIADAVDDGKINGFKKESKPVDSTTPIDPPDNPDPKPRNIVIINGIKFYEDSIEDLEYGGYWQGELVEDCVVNGVPLLGETIATFASDGELRKGTLAKNFATDKGIFAAGTEIEVFILNDGYISIRNGTLAEPFQLNGISIPAGSIYSTETQSPGLYILSEAITIGEGSSHPGSIGEITLEAGWIVGDSWGHIIAHPPGFLENPLHTIGSVTYAGQTFNVSSLTFDAETPYLYFLLADGETVTYNGVTLKGHLEVNPVFAVGITTEEIVLPTGLIIPAGCDVQFVKEYMEPVCVYAMSKPFYLLNGSLLPQGSFIYLSNNNVSYFDFTVSVNTQNESDPFAIANILLPKDTRVYVDEFGDITKISSIGTPTHPVTVTTSNNEVIEFNVAGSDLLLYPNGNPQEGVLASSIIIDSVFYPAGTHIFFNIDGTVASSV
jgi:hypothetical protein